MFSDSDRAGASSAKSVREFTADDDNDSDVTVHAANGLVMRFHAAFVRVCYGLSDAATEYLYFYTPHDGSRDRVRAVRSHRTNSVLQTDFVVGQNTRIDFYPTRCDYDGVDCGRCECRRAPCKTRGRGRTLQCVIIRANRKFDHKTIFRTYVLSDRYCRGVVRACSTRVYHIITPVIHGMCHEVLCPSRRISCVL